MDNLGEQEMHADHGGSSWPTAKPVHLTKSLNQLCHMPRTTWVALKIRSITTCDRLLSAVGRYEDRETFAQATQISMDDLTILVRRADLARVRGLGWVFRSMLEELDVADIATLAHHDSHKLHERLRTYNKTFKIARRSPTLAEVFDWISQAQRLPKMVTYIHQYQKATG
ncbi:MAG: DUF4332 domain-containing protein [Geminicoccaceae bacterium]